jgi:hypothetical protein
MKGIPNSYFAIIGGGAAAKVLHHQDALHKLQQINQRESENSTQNTLHRRRNRREWQRRTVTIGVG